MRAAGLEGVLKVPDQEATFWSLMTSLPSANVELLEAGLFRRARRQFRRRGPCSFSRPSAWTWVLLDVMTPAMDGYEVCGRIKISTRTMYVPVVMVTALDQT
jgi:DNA-binding response OmpR family regulator